MAKTLSERVADRMAKTKPSRGSQNRATFLALRSEIKETMDDGWPIKFIWATLYEEGKIKFGYQAFREYVNKLILVNQIQIENGTNKTETVNQAETQKKESKPAGFVYDPVPKKEELF